MKLRAILDGEEVTVVDFLYKGNDLRIVYIDSDGNINVGTDETAFTFVERLG